MANTVRGIQKNSSGLIDPVFNRSQIMENVIAAAEDSGSETVAHTTRYPMTGNGGLNIWTHATGAGYSGGDTIEVKLYKEEVINSTRVFNEIAVLKGITIATSAGDAVKASLYTTSAFKDATHFSVSATFNADQSCYLKVVAEKINNKDDNSHVIEETTDSKWVIVDNECSATLDCTDNATCAGYVEVTVDKNAVDSGGTASVQQWDAGTITNDTGHIQTGDIYAIRFVVTASNGHKLIVKV